MLDTSNKGRGRLLEQDCDGQDAQSKFDVANHALQHVGHKAGNESQSQDLPSDVAWTTSPTATTLTEAADAGGTGRGLR